MKIDEQTLKESLKKFNDSFPLFMVSYRKDFKFTRFDESKGGVNYFIVNRIWSLVKAIPQCYFDMNLYTMNVINRALMEHWILLHYLYFKSFEDDSIFDRYLKYYYLYEKGEMNYQYHKSRSTVISKKDIMQDFYFKNDIDNYDLINKTSKDFSFAAMCKFIDDAQKRNLGNIEDSFAETYSHLIARYSYYSSFIHAGPFAVVNYENTFKDTNETTVEKELKNTFSSAFIFLETSANLVLLQTNAPEDEFMQLKKYFAWIRITIKRYLDNSVIDFSS